MAATAANDQSSGPTPPKIYRVWRSAADRWPGSKAHASGVRAPTPPVRSIARYHAEHSRLSRRLPQHTHPQGPPTSHDEPPRVGRNQPNRITHT